MEQPSQAPQATARPSVSAAGRSAALDRLERALTEALAGAGDRVDVLRRTADVLVPAFAGWCVVDVVTPAGTERVVAVPEAFALGPVHFPAPPWESPGVLGRALAGRGPVVADADDLSAVDGTWEGALAALNPPGSAPVLVVPVQLLGSTTALVSAGLPGSTEAGAARATGDLVARLAGSALEAIAVGATGAGGDTAGDSADAGETVQARGDDLRAAAARQRLRAQRASERSVRPVDGSDGADGTDGAGRDPHQRGAALQSGSARLVQSAADLHYQLAARQADRNGGPTGRTPRDPASAMATVDVDGVCVPLIGLGTWQLKGAEAYAAVRLGLQAGHRHVDTGTVYDNQKAVGRALAESDVPRHEVVVTTKLPPFHVGRERRTLEESLTDLGVDVVDLWLLHWTLNGRSQPDVWERMIELRDEGLVQAIGVSNYEIAQIDELIADTGVAPAVNQLRWCPALHSPELVEAHRQRGIVLAGFSPLNTSRLNDPVVTGAAARHGVDPARVVLRWHMQHGIPTLVRSTQPTRIRSNLDVLGFELTDHDMAALDAMH